MSKITQAQIKAAYAVAKRVHDPKDEIRSNKAAEKLFYEHAINYNSAKDYIYVFLCMRKGKEYDRTINVVATKYYLSQIEKDYGVAALENAVRATWLHVAYYEKKQNTTMRQIRRLLAEYEEILANSQSHQSPITYPDEIPKEAMADAPLIEGVKKQVTVDAYERNSEARAKCIARYGTKCCVCDLDFESVYGEIGAGYIHVHHLTPLAEIDAQYQIDPIADLRPVCPNCHAMLHKKNPPLTPQELRVEMDAAKKAPRNGAE